jgi:hypothetical protein
VTVYVDKPRHKLGRMTMCHLVADTLPELHAMADTLGLRRAWFQDHGFPHYDICKAKRAEAIRLGAQEIGLHELGAMLRGWRQRA